MTAYEARKRLVDKALTFVGTTEGSIVHKWIVDTYNKIDPLPRGYKVKYTDAWCATFVTVCAQMADMLDIIPAECGCPEMVRKFQSMGRWQERDDYRPGLGDIAFYDWGNNPTGDNRGTPAHVGIVTAVYSDSFVITEGNRSDAVRNITVKVNDSNLRGFGLPDFARWLIDHGYTNGGDYPMPEEPSKWARAAWQWAKENKITDGTRPHDVCTREELVTMLYRYHKMEENK